MPPFFGKPAGSLTQEEYARIDRGYAAIPPRTRKKEKKVRTWSPGSLARNDGSGSASSFDSKSYGGKKNVEWSKKKHAPRITAKSVAHLLKRVYGYALFSDFGDFDRPYKKEGNQVENGRANTGENQGTKVEEKRSQMTPPEKRGKLLALLLEKLYGFVIMTNMINPFNKLE